MDWRTFFATVIEALAWPATALLIVYLLNTTG